MGAVAADSLEVYLENKKGVEAFKNGKMDEAKESFGRAQAHDPNRPELLYNQGVMQLQEKNIDGALEGFGKSAENALKSGNSSLSARSLYNLGSSLEAKGDAESAIRSYLAGLDQAKRAADPQLESDFRKKIELMVQKEEQKQKNKGGEGQKDKNDPKDKQKDQSDPQKQGEQNPGQTPEEKKQQQGQGEENRKEQKQGFKSEKLSKEDAERVMNELSERDKQLRQKLNKQQKKPRSIGKDRDW